MKREKRYGLVPIILRNSIEYFKKAKLWGLAEQMVAVLRALSWTAGIITTQRLFDAITRPDLSETDFCQIASYLGIPALVLIGQQLLGGLGQYLLSRVSYTNMGLYMVEFQEKLGRLPAKHFEDTNFLNDVNKAKECLEYETLGHFASTCLQLVTYYLVFFVSVGGYLFWLSPVLPFVILLSFVPAFLGQLAQVKIFSVLEEEKSQLRRECDYYQKTIIDKTFFKETRLLGAFNYFYDLFIRSLSIKVEKTWKTERKVAIIHLLLGLISFIGLGSAILILFYSTMSGQISIGSFAAVFVSLTQIFSIMDEMVHQHLSGGSEALGQVTNVYRLMDLSEVAGEFTNPDYSKNIVANEISFAYPLQNKLAVKDVSLTIHDGETIAIVGENGSGKSTLVRLLMGLYTPDSGVVTIGGLNTKTTHPDSLYSHISGIFQHYQRYKMTLAENVSISDVKRAEDIEKINRSLQEADFDKGKIDLDTMMSPEFGGVDLSGGQWQRLAIARGLYREHHFILLDEPTASIDPIEEAMLFNQFRRLTAGKSAAIVTHRLGSTKLADRIIVMDKGEISDFGTHEELLNRGGKYADMWQAQAKWYEKR